MITVLIADDQPAVRKGFTLFLADHPDIRVIGEAESGKRALDHARAMRPDVVLMDVRMPGGDGLTATREILTLDQPPRVIIVTTFDLDEYLFAAIDLGAAGFLLKDTGPDELASAVLTAAAGGLALAPALTPRLAAEFARRRPRPTAAQANEHSAQALTPRERDIAANLAQGHSNQAIATKLHLEPSTVKTHVSNIAKKINAKNRVQIAVWAATTDHSVLNSDLKYKH
ncbi:response regulator [Hoyosella subflava]|uniref:Two component transcriptional regulator n=1 Tax=Hoyosella subflava (strain DSM 45089 / JCM 17490 / NBRC 109087 / DQS3-9A1) TaxID=443218 RepID=F6ESD5_HOYSD|nr:response regulator transcription factor [Hoyosella subflava]AEF43056.1 Two component transcriptional regulator [Hoyosella subflava DQS3-9A1]